MNLKNQKPVFVPREYWEEIEKLPKAALMDMVWDFATRCSGGLDTDDLRTMEEFRSERDIVLHYRAQARVS